MKDPGLIKSSPGNETKEKRDPGPNRPRPIRKYLTSEAADSSEESDSISYILPKAGEESLDMASRIEAEQRRARMRELQDQFKTLAGDDDLISREEFLRGLQSRNTMLADNLFAHFDTDRDGFINCHEFTDFLMKFEDTGDKIDLVFLTYDLKNEKRMGWNEMHQLLQAMIASSTSLPLEADDVRQMTDLLFAEAVRESGTSDYVTKAGFRALIEKDEEVAKDLASLVDHWLGKIGAPKPEDRGPRTHEEKAIDMAARTEADPQFYSVLVVYLILVGSMMIMAGVWHGHTKDKNGEVNVALIMARIFGFPLNLVCTMVYVFMLRNFLNGLREIGWGRYLPLDHHTFYHILSGWIIFSFGLAHTVAHFVNFSLNVVPDPNQYLTQNDLSPETVGYYPPPEGGAYSFWDWMLTPRPHLFGLIPGWANLTGVFLILITLIMFATSQPQIRRGGYFNLFYFCHWLYLPFAILLVIHAPNFTYFFPLAGVFLVLSLIQKVVYGHVQTQVRSAFLLEPKCVCLVLDKPENFNFRTGDWISVKIPSIAQYEWHAFTISSSPELPQILTLHIKVVGPWTEALEHRVSMDHAYMVKNKIIPKDYLGEKYLPHTYNDRAKMVTYDNGGVQLKEVVTRIKAGQAKIPGFEVKLDGPFHAPATSIFMSQHAVLIATGIGVTPMACILQSVLQRHLKRVVNCPDCRTRFTATQEGDVGNLRKLDFIWVVRDPREVMWFMDLLTSIEMEQETLGADLPKIINTTIYVTRAWSNVDMDTLVLRLALNLYHKTQKKDILYGLKTKMIGGRPDFKAIFGNLQDSRHGAVSVYFCGNSVVGNILQKKCEQFKYVYHREIF